MPDHPQTRPQVLQYYHQKLEAAEKEVKDSAGQWSIVGIVRGLLLLASIVLGAMALVNAFELRSIAGPIAGVAVCRVCASSVVPRRPANKDAARQNANHDAP